MVACLAIVEKHGVHTSQYLAIIPLIFTFILYLRIERNIDVD
jgi:hypothetical protein